MKALQISWKYQWIVSVSIIYVHMLNVHSAIDICTVTWNMSITVQYKCNTQGNSPLRLVLRKIRLFVFLKNRRPHWRNWDASLKMAMNFVVLDGLYLSGVKISILACGSQGMYVSTTCKPRSYGNCTLPETNISPKNGILKMIFLFPRWDMLIPWRVPLLYCFFWKRIFWPDVAS